MKTRICHFNLTQFGLLLIASSHLLIASCNGSQGKRVIPQDVPISAIEQLSTWERANETFTQLIFVHILQHKNEDGNKKRNENIRSR